MVLKRVLVIAAVSLAFTSILEGSRSTNGSRVTRASNDRVLAAERSPMIGAQKHHDILTVFGPEMYSDPWFGVEQASFIRDWFAQQAKVGALPAEDARHDTAPQLRRDGVLPEDLRQRAQPLPLALERQLPVLTGNLRRVLVLGDVVLLEDDTLRIVDFIPDVF